MNLQNPTTLRDADRYLTLVAWAERRYGGRAAPGRRIGAAPVQWIERRAAERYLDANPLLPAEPRWQ